MHHSYAFADATEGKIGHKYPTDFGNKSDDAGALRRLALLGRRGNRVRAAPPLRCDDDVIEHGANAVDLTDDLRNAR
jgi:hypothetical protein